MPFGPARDVTSASNIACITVRPVGTLNASSPSRATPAMSASATCSSACSSPSIRSRSWAPTSVSTPTGEHCSRGLVYLGCVHAQPRTVRHPTFRRMIASHTRALTSARDLAEPAGQLAARDLESTATNGTARRRTHACRRRRPRRGRNVNRLGSHAIRRSPIRAAVGCQPTDPVAAAVRR